MQISAVLALVLQDWLDGIVVVVLLAWHISTSIISTKQGYDVQASLVGDSLITEIVTRGSKKIRISATELVPGDIVHVSQVSGDNVARPSCDMGQS